MRHFAASIDDLNGWPTRPSTVVILENKETGYALTDRFRRLAVDGAAPQRGQLPRLTATEQCLYQHLVNHTTTEGKALLLEQERIPWQHVYPILLTSLGLR